MASFKKIETRAFNKNTPRATSDTAYWRKLEFPVTIKEFTSIDYIDISPVEPHYVAVTSGPKVDVYQRQTAQVWRSLSRFKRLAFGAKFRQDGQLMLVGSEEGQVKLFNHRTKTLLRLFKGHDRPTHRVDFVHGTSQVVTFSDDKTASVWDIGDESKVCTLSGHKDFIRAGIVSPASEHIILSGSYDHTVKLWDKRTSSSVLTVDHGAPVESIVCYPSGGVFVSAGGNEVRVWDSVGGKLLCKLSQHHKTVTCVAFASDKKRLLSGSLDRHIKIYDVNTYTVVHSLDYPAPLLCMAIAPGDSTVVVGMISGGSGLVSFQHRQTEVAEKPVISKRKSRRDFKDVITEDTMMRSGDHVIKPEEPDRLAKHDNHLRKYQYSKALDSVLMPFVANTKPHITVNLLRELIKRRGLKTAVAGRDSKQLTRLMVFLKKHIRHPLYKNILMDVADTLIDVYGNSLDDNPGMVKLFRDLRSEIFIEMELTREHTSLMGVLQMFLTTSDTHTETSSSTVLPHSSLVPLSENTMLHQSPIKSTPVDIVDIC